MWSSFVEGVGEIILPCAVGMLVPGMVVVLLARRRRLAALGAFAVAAALMAWLRAADTVGSSPMVLLVLAAIGGGALLVEWRQRAWTALAGGTLYGFVAGSTWIPCVGENLGVILNNAPGDPLAQLLPMAAYVFGVCAVLFALALVPVVFPSVEPWLENRFVQVTGIVAAGVLVVALAGGFYGDVLSRLAQLSVR